MPAKPEVVANESSDCRPERDYTAKLLALLEYSTNTGGTGALEDTLSVLLLSLMGEFIAPGAAVLLRSPDDGLEVRAGKGTSRRLLGRQVCCPWKSTDDGDDLDGLLGPSAEWAAATDAAVRGGAAAYAGGGGGVVRGGGGDGKAVKKGPRATSAGPTRPASGNAASHPNSKAAWDSSFSAPVSKATVGGCTSRITVDP